MRISKALTATFSAFFMFATNVATGGAQPVSAQNLDHTVMADDINSLVARSASAGRTAVVVPMYIYPVGWTSPAAWQPLYTAVAKYPDLNFHVIINPNSGPGASAPNSDYELAIAALRKYSNVIMLGYVHTTYATRSSDQIYADIADYSNWASIGYHMDGIFFDEAPSAISDTLYNYMSNITCYAKDSITTTANGGQAMIYFNPGTEADIRYYTLADYIVMFEDTYAAYLTGDPEDSTTAPMANTCFMVHSMPGGWDSGQLSSLVNGLADGKGLGSVFLTTNNSTSNPYGAFGDDWTAFVEALGEPMM